MKFLLLLLFALPALAHDLQYDVSNAQAVVLRLYYMDAKPFAFEGYEIYPAGQNLPVQVGRTDARGQVAFLPPKAGEWRIKAISDDGHGLDFRIRTDAAATVQAAEKPLFERYGRIAVGVAVILGLFGFLALYVRRKQP